MHVFEYHLLIIIYLFIQCQLDVSTQIECLTDALQESTTIEINVPLILCVIKAIGQSIDLSGANAEKLREYVVKCKLLKIILNVLSKLEVKLNKMLSTLWC